jgi:hypothetical protein
LNEFAPPRQLRRYALLTLKVELMARIDNPIDQIEAQHDETPPNHTFEIMMAGLSGMPLIGAVNAIRQYAASNATRERFESLIREILEVIRNLDRDTESLKEKIESPAFIQALIVATERTIRTSNREKIKRFATVLGYELAKGPDEGEWEDVEGFIRTLDEIGEADIKVLAYLYRFQSECFRGDELIDYNLIFSNMGQLLGNITQTGMSKDEFYARCAKLGGFGLVLNVERRKDVVPPGDYSYRLTKLGKRLMMMLDATPNRQGVPAAQA